MKYELEIKEGGLSNVVSDIETDVMSLGHDAQNQISDSLFYSGPMTAEYGSEGDNEPWTFMWFGCVKPFEVPDSWLDSGADADFEERVERAVESLMKFFDDSCVERGYSVSDYEWRVQVAAESGKRRPSGVHTMWISWVPKENL